MNYKGARDNSLKGTRQNNFVTSGEEGLMKVTFFEWHKIGVKDCLTKTQDPANLITTYRV